jgi:hypothetical protein
MQLHGLGQTMMAKEAHLDSVRLTHGIQATRRNDLGNSGLLLRDGLMPKGSTRLASHLTPYQA